MRSWKDFGSSQASPGTAWFLAMQRAKSGTQGWIHRKHVIWQPGALEAFTAAGQWPGRRPALATQCFALLGVFFHKYAEQEVLMMEVFKRPFSLFTKGPDILKNYLLHFIFIVRNIQSRSVVERSFA